MKRFLIFVFLTGRALTAADPDARELFERARMLEEKNQNLAEAIRLFGQVVSHAATERALAARAQYEQGVLYERLGKRAEAQRAFRAVLRDFADQRAAVTLARLKVPAGTSVTGVAVRQVWTGDHVDGNGSPSPDGRYISFTDWKTGDVAIRETATGESRRLTNDGNPSWGASSAVAMFSTYSPDGKRIAYSWFAPASVEIRVVGIDGHGRRTVYRIEGRHRSVEVRDWSPDGKMLLAAVYAEDGEPKLILVSLADGSAQEIALKGRWIGGRAVFSPDGAYIAYNVQQSGDEAGQDINIMSANGSQDIPVVQHPADDSLIGWAPRGSALLFISDRSGTPGIWSVPFSAGKPAGAARIIKPDVGTMYPFALARSGALYYFASLQSADIYIAEIDVAAGRVTSTPIPATQRFVGAKRSAAWSPDGKALMYVAQRGRGHLCIVDTGTGKEREVYPRMGGVIRVLNWHPDGRSVFVQGTGMDGVWGIYRVTLDDGSARMIAPKIIDRPAWSPDATAMFYGGEALFRRDVSSGQVTELYRHPAARALGNPNTQVSPDGRQLAVMLRDVPAGYHSLAVLPVSGGEPKILYSIKQPDLFGGNTFAWTPDANYILVSHSQNNRSQVLRVSVATGEAKPIGIEMPGMIRMLRMNPDGRRIAFLNGEDKDEIWVMENFLNEARAAR